jgi:general secretion pathway protein D
MNPAQRIAAYLAILSFLTSCATPSSKTVRDVENSDTAVVTGMSDATVDESTSTTPGAAPDGQSGPTEDKIKLGSGVFVQAARGPEPQVHAGDDGVTLNFEKADLREFLKVVFNTILGENYLVDPTVGGTVTLHTTRPITRQAVLPTVEAVLEQNAAALLFDDGIYKIVPLADAERGSRSPAVGRYSSSRTTGYGIQVVPLQYASAAEIQKVLTPLVAEGSTLRVDEARNVLILSGPKFRLEELLATVRTFDVDWLEGMSFALYRLEYADSLTMVDELNQIIDGDGSTPLAGIVRLLPIARLNAVLVISHNPENIARMGALIEQFDWGVEGSAGRRLFVYELENGKAENIAGALQEIYGQVTAPVGEQAALGSSFPGAFRPAAAVTRPVSQAAVVSSAVGDLDSNVSVDGLSEVKIIADEDNNSILVLASQKDYRSIEAAIRRLDKAPRQVLIEATIAEVSLSDTLNYGVRWFLENNDFQLGMNAPVPSQASGDGLAFAFFDQSSDVTAFFDMLASKSSVNFLSTPQVMVLDNQTANIRVGDQIPVTTRSSQSTSNPDAPIVTEVQFRDTGTLLTVTPHINAGGQVMLEVSQEVSLPGTEPAVGGGGNVAISQRSINSSVIVQSGQTVVLGGLILENRGESRSGVPVLMNIPLIGGLFSQTKEDIFRTELIITIKPVVVGNGQEMRRVTEELRMRMQKASDLEYSARDNDGR